MAEYGFGNPEVIEEEVDILIIGGGMASARTCPHGDADRLLVSGTKLRKWLSEGAAVPPEFSRPEVLEVLRAYYAGLEQHEKVEVKLAGHSAR